MASIDLDKVARQLADERSTLVHQLHELGANEAGELTGSVEFGEAFADAGAATAERTETIGIVSSLGKRLAEVDKAIARLEEGTFGTCVVCGGDIDADRLAFRPTSVMCVTCKSKASSRTDAPHT